MLPERMLPHRVSIVHPDLAGRDRYNAVVKDYTAGTTVTGVLAYVQPRSRSEDLNDRDASVTEWNMLTNNDIGALDRVTWNGDDYEVVGEPAAYSTPRGWHHNTAVLRRVVG